MIPILFVLISIMSPLNNGLDDRVPTFSARLIHVSSPKNPFFNPNYTYDDFINVSASNSIARSLHFGSSTKSKFESAPIKGSAFIMQYSMGTPAVDVYGILDTGSSLAWFQCLPCINCYHFNGNYTLFDPSKSSTYQRVPCDDAKCGMFLPANTCSSSGDCRYLYYYADGTYTSGFVSLDSMTIQSVVDDYENLSTIDNVIFGCGDDNYDEFGFPGIFGTGNYSYSFIRQMNYSYFSYFMSANKSVIEGEVHFGKGLDLGDNNFTTPIVGNPNTGYYYLQLEGIRIDDYPVYIPSGTFTNSEDGKSGFVIDSGTAFTTIASVVYDKVKQSLIEQMRAKFFSEAERYNDQFELCYWDASGAPQVEFEFTGMMHRLCWANQWIKMPNSIYCFSILPTNSNISILGIHQQMNTVVSYDLENNSLSLYYPGTCPDDPKMFYDHRV